MLGVRSGQWRCRWASDEVSRHRALQLEAACQSQPQLAGFHQGHHPSLDSRALLKGEVEHLVTLSKSSAMLTLSIVTNTFQHIRVPTHKLLHTISHVLPCNLLPEAQRSAMGRMKIADCKKFLTAAGTLWILLLHMLQGGKTSQLDWQRRGRSAKRTWGFYGQGTLFINDQ